MKFAAERMPMDLYRTAILKIEATHMSVEQQTIEILNMYTWVVMNTSNVISIWDWTLEKETEFKLRFL